MHPRIAELEQYLRQQRAQLTADVAQIAAARYRVSPGAERWSVVHVLEHLAIVERRVTSGITVWMREAKAAGLEKETQTSPILPTIDVNRFVDRTRPLKSPAEVTPTGTLSMDDAMRGIAEARTAFLAVVTAECDGYALAQVVQPHPAFGPLNMYEWIAFVGGHMMRHAMQIREIGMAFAASGTR